MPRPDAPLLATPVKLSALGLAALLAMPEGGPSILCVPSPPPDSPAPFPTPESMAVPPARPSREARRRARGKSKATGHG